MYCISHRNSHTHTRTHILQNQTEGLVQAERQRTVLNSTVSGKKQPPNKYRLCVCVFSSFRYLNANGNKNESESNRNTTTTIAFNAVLRANETVLRVSTLSSCACAMNILSASHSIKYHFAFIRLCFRFESMLCNDGDCRKISENENWKIFKRRTQMHHHQKRQTRFSMSKHKLNTIYTNTYEYTACNVLYI